MENNKPAAGNAKVKVFNAYMWNSSLKDDELGIQCLKALKEEQKQGKMSQTSGQSGAPGKEEDEGAGGMMGDVLTQEGVKL